MIGRVEVPVKRLQRQEEKGEGERELSSGPLVLVAPREDAGEAVLRLLVPADYKQEPSALWTSHVSFSVRAEDLLQAVRAVAWPWLGRGER